MSSSSAFTGVGTDAGAGIRGEGFRTSADESRADGGNEAVVKTVLAVVREGEDEDVLTLLQGALPTRTMAAVEGEGVKKKMQG